jgi:hypothetical protein
MRREVIRDNRQLIIIKASLSPQWLLKLDLFLTEKRREGGVGWASLVPFLGNSNPYKNKILKKIGHQVNYVCLCDLKAPTQMHYFFCPLVSSFGPFFICPQPTDITKQFIYFGSSAHSVGEFCGIT